MAYTKLLGKSVPQGAATHVFLAVAPEVKDVSGKYFVDCREEPYWVRAWVYDRRRDKARPQSLIRA